MYAQHANANRPAQCSPCEGPYSGERQQAKMQGASGLVGAISATECARESHVPEEMGQLRAVVSQLESEIDSLCARLSCVTAPLPDELKGEGPPDTFRVPLADDIRSQRRRVARVVDLARNLSMALEL